MTMSGANQLDLDLPSRACQLRDADSTRDCGLRNGDLPAPAQRLVVIECQGEAERVHGNPLNNTLFVDLKTLFAAFGAAALAALDFRA
jgi:hypothetical protein